MKLFKFFKNKSNKNSIIILPVISAILLGLSRLPVNFDMLVFVAFIPLFYYFDLFDRAEQKSNTILNNNFIKLNTSFTKLFKHGFVFSTIFLMISIHWISIVTLPGFLGIILLFGIVFGVLFWLLSLLYRYKPILHFFSLISGWLSFEYATNFTEFKFPWFNIAYGLEKNLNLIQIAEIGGVTLIGLLILVINYLLYLAITKNRRYFLICFTIIIIWYGYGIIRLKTLPLKETDVSIAVLQGSIEQEIKWHSSMIDSTFNIYNRLGQEAINKEVVDLIIFPEAALPVYLLQRKQYYYRLLDMVFDFEKPVFTGFPYYKEEYKYKGQIEPYLYYNAANLFDPESLQNEVYFKNVLVPFGERMPFLSTFPFLWKLQFGQANFEHGEKPGYYQVKDYTFSPLICFEIVFPGFLRDITENINPDFWVNITNDAWFKKSIGTHQHAYMAVFRTIETRKSVFRSANTGYSFYTTPDGSIREKTSLYDRTFFTGKLLIYEGVTPFVKYGFILPLLFFVFFTLQIINLLVLLYLRKFVW